MKSKTVILAGGAGGLGSGIAQRLAAQGFVPVIGCLKNEERAKQLAFDINRNYGIQAQVVVGDVLDHTIRNQLIETARSLGDMYGLVPLVGKPARIPIETATADDLLESTRINFVAPILLARDFVAATEEDDVSIVFVATMQAIGVFPGSIAYAAPKAALVHSARILAKQLGGSGHVRVNVVAPGVTTAGMAQESVLSGKYDSFIEKDVITRFGSPDDVARVIQMFLEVDNYMTGQVVTVDGGMTTRM